jgi:hypothetical protein
MPSSRAWANNSATRACSWISFLIASRADHQLVQAKPALVTRITTLGTALGTIHHKFAILAVILQQSLVHIFIGIFAVSLEGLGMNQLCAVLGKEKLHLFGIGRVCLLAFAQTLGQALGKNAQAEASAKLKGSMPISSKRMTDSGALLVCSVANTRWPVSEASIPVEVVSLSRISPTMMMSGSARRKAFMMTAKSSPAFLLICTWRRPFWVISNRILGRPYLGIWRIEELQYRMQCGGLARTGRAADEEQAVRLADRRLERCPDW